MLTPVERVDGIYIKRDDLFTVAGVKGGKARTCWCLAQGAEGLITAGSRHSPQVPIVSGIAKYLGIPCHIHIPQGTNSPSVIQAIQDGAKIIRHRPGYNTVIISRAKQDAMTSGYTYIPFGMECTEAVNETLVQTNNIPNDAKRIVVPVGSGMSLAGILIGLVANGIRIPVVGVKISADPTKRLDRYAPLFWRAMVTIISSKFRYEDYVQAKLGEIDLDPIYEAKCVEYLSKGDLFWIVGVRNNAG